MKKHQGCISCKNNNDFDIPEDLIESIEEGNAVIFAGAGISTENRQVFPYTFYEDISAELGISKKNVDFPEVMEKLEQKNGRLDLINAISDRLAYVESFPEIYRCATKFHRELSAIPQINEIVTTNWDDYFEKECGARPFVHEEDAAFLDLPGRKVLKIHGSINSVSSIIATTKDYKKAKKALLTGILGSKLKLLLANKTIIFVGYSFNDYDFRDVYKLVSKLVGNLCKKRYMVTINQKDANFLKKQTLTPIYTDGTFFLHKIRHELFSRGGLLPLKALDVISLYLYEATEEHRKLSKKMEQVFDGELFYCQSYQDGLIHSYEYYLNRSKDGYIYVLEELSKVFFVYEKKLEEKMQNKKWWDVAYIEGYIMGILSIRALGSKENYFPDYYFNIYNNTFSKNLNSFSKSSKNKRKNVKSIDNEMKKILAKHGDIERGIIFHHTPFLF